MADSNSPKQVNYDKKGPLVVKALKERHFDAYYCSTIEEAKEQALALIDKSKSIGWGGSLSLDETGILPAIKAGGYITIDRDTAKTPAERVALMKKALMADQFILSANAITADGIIVNLDANGNRVAAMVYGPNNVIVVAGMNKVVKSVQDAVTRTREIAAPMNAQRFDIKTPCKVTGECGNCKCPDSICSSMVITRLCRPANKIKVILVGQDLGM